MIVYQVFLPKNPRGIAYIEVRKRNICLFTDRYNCLQDRTFSEFENLLAPNSYLRINRQIVIMRSHLTGYSNQNVYLRQGEQEICFTYSNAPSFNVLQQLQELDASLYRGEEEVAV